MSRISDIDESRRRVLLSLLASGCFSAFPASSAPLAGMPRKLAAGQFFYRFSGDVRLNGIAVTLTTPIAAGNVLTTGQKSFAIFVFEKDALILLSGSEMTVGSTSGEKPVESLSEGAKPSLVLSAYVLNKGKVLSVLASRTTRITTSSALVRILGTGVYVEVEPEESYVCVCYGSTLLESALDPSIQEAVVTEHHDQPKYVTGGSEPKILPAPFKNHDDEELLLIETLVGRTTPYLVPAGRQKSLNSYF